MAKKIVCAEEETTESIAVKKSKKEVRRQTKKDNPCIVVFLLPWIVSLNPRITTFSRVCSESNI